MRIHCITCLHVLDYSLHSIHSSHIESLKFCKHSIWTILLLKMKISVKLLIDSITKTYSIVKP